MTALYIKTNNLAQLGALLHIQRSFEPDGVHSLELIHNGIRLTDCTSARADFIYGDGPREDGYCIIKRLRRRRKKEGAA